jgi:hypothetical protein
MENSELRAQLVNNGIKRKFDFKTAQERAAEYLNLCQALIKNE